LFLLLRYEKSSELAPTVLRVALSLSNSEIHKFQLNEMEDATECFITLLHGICITTAVQQKKHFLSRLTSSMNGTESKPFCRGEDECHGYRCPAHQVFGLRTREERACNCEEILYGKTRNAESWIFEFLVPFSALAAVGKESLKNQPPPDVGSSKSVPGVPSVNTSVNVSSGKESVRSKPSAIMTGKESVRGLKRFSKKKFNFSKLLEDIFASNAKKHENTFRSFSFSSPDLHGGGDEQETRVKFDEDICRRTETFEKVLSKTEADNQGKCQDCGIQHPLRSLVRVPPVFTLNILWDTLVVEKETIREVFHGISPFIDLSNVFQVLSEDPAQMYLQSFVCYYGEHYVAFSFSWTSEDWLMIDDTVIKSCGQWKEVTEKCVASKYQPLLLFYTKFCSSFDAEAQFPPPSAAEIIKLNKLLEEVKKVNQSK